MMPPWHELARSEMSEKRDIKVEQDGEVVEESSSDLKPTPTEISDLLPAPPSLDGESELFNGFDPEDLIGDTLAGRYEIEQQIGKGGMGIVYLASQRALNRKVVVKVLARGLNDNEEAIQRFEREALGLSQLQHPNTVTIYDFGRDRDLAYIVMEYVEGQTLSQAMRRRDGGLEFEEFATIASQIVDALGEAHARGIIHRDIKPSNIMLTERHGHANFVKVLDFGLAKLIHDAAEVTKKQNLVGSVAFLAPEQILGLEFDQRADVYALGVLFYYLLSGQKPFRGEDDISVLYQHIHKHPTPLPELLPPGHDIPFEIIDLVHLCLSKEPEARPVDARDLLSRMQNEGARSLFQVPWVSGEFSTSSLMAAIPDREATPISGQLSTVKAHSSGAINRPASLSGSYAQVSQTGLSQVSGVHVLPQQPQSRRNSLLVALAILLALSLAGGALVVAMNKQDRPAVDIGAQSDQITRVLDQTDVLIEKQKWGQAESMLQSIRQSATSHPELLSRVAESDERIIIGKLLQKAKIAEESGEIKTARQRYEEILARNPSHEIATAKLAKLPSEDGSGGEGTLGSLTIEANVEATVLLNGKEAGKTPFIKQLGAASYSIKVVADGYDDWEKAIDLGSGESVMLDASLEKQKRTGRTKTTSSRKTSSKTKAVEKPAETEAAPEKTEEKKKGSDFLLPPDKTKKKKNKLEGLLPVGG